MQTRKIEREQVFMNTIVRIILYSDKPTIFTEEKLQEAFNCFADVVKKYTRFNSKSELAKLNNSGGKPQKVSREFFELIEFMLNLVNLTNESYDPTIIDLLESYGFSKDKNYEVLDDPGLFDRIQKLVQTRPNPSQIKLDRENYTVILAPRQRLDLGSIGKGYAVDLAYQVLEDFPAFMVNAGGDIRVKGPKPDETPWEVGLDYSQLPNKKLHQEKLLGTIQLTDGSICGSGGWARKVKFFHHLLNPKTGTPINEISQTYVVAPTALEADPWATVLFTMGRPGLDLLEERGYTGLILDKNSKIYTTKNFKYQ